MTTLLLISLLGALLELDTTYALQLTFSRGIIAGPLLGLIGGDVITGLQVGIFSELLFTDVQPLGGLLPPSAAICCTISLALCVLGIPTYFAFFFGVIGSILFASAEAFFRKRRADWIEQQEGFFLKHPAYLARTIAKMLLLSYIATALFLLCFNTAIGLAFAGILPFIPEQIHLAGKFAYMAVAWIGLAALLAAFRLKTR